MFTHILHIAGYIALGVAGLAAAIVVAIIVALMFAESNGENPFQ